MKKLGILFPLLALLCFLLGLSRVERSRSDEGRQRLEDALRRSAAACYALDGAYPASVDQLCRRTNLHWDEDTYVVHYEIFAANLAPEITVMERLP